jgi:hypothetical protein
VVVAITHGTTTTHTNRRKTRRMILKQDKTTQQFVALCYFRPESFFSSKTYPSLFLSNILVFRTHPPTGAQMWAHYKVVHISAFFCYFAQL